MSAISRRTMITRGLAAAAGLSGLAVAERVPIGSGWSRPITAASTDPARR